VVHQQYDGEHPRTGHRTRHTCGAPRTGTVDPAAEQQGGPAAREEKPGDNGGQSPCGEVQLFTDRPGERTDQADREDPRGVKQDGADDEPRPAAPRLPTVLCHLAHCLSGRLDRRRHPAGSVDQTPGSPRCQRLS
jgi:hypothetical protein